MRERDGVRKIERRLCKRGSIVELGESTKE